MPKAALATQIPGELKRSLNRISTERGMTISTFVETALREKIEEVREEEALTRIALKRLAEAGQKTYGEFKKFIRQLT